MTVTVGIDIGGTSVLAMAFDESGATVGRSEVPTGTAGGASVVDSVKQAWSGLEMAAKASSAGVGVPGRVDPRTGDVRLAVNLGIGADPYPLGTELHRAFGLPVAVENDVKAAALGVHESLRSEGQAPNSLALVNLGTGIAAGVVIDGELFRGSRGMAGEIGHTVVEPGGEVCRCGQRGCLETVVAGPAIARAWPESEGSALPLFAAAAGGDAEAAPEAERISGYIARALLWLAATYDVEKFYLGGGVSRAGAPFLQAVRDRLSATGQQSKVAAELLSPDQVLLAPDQGWAGPRGAAVLAARHTFPWHGKKEAKDQSNKGAI
ncbi:MAG: ROK family protein [Actinomycetota bacterium]